MRKDELIRSLGLFVLHIFPPTPTMMTQPLSLIQITCLEFNGHCYACLVLRDFSQICVSFDVSSFTMFHDICGMKKLL